MHNSNQDSQSAKSAVHVVSHGPALNGHFNNYSHQTMVLFHCGHDIEPNELSLKTMNLATVLVPEQQDIFKRYKIAMLETVESASLLQNEFTLRTLFAQYPRGFAFRLSPDQSAMSCSCGITNLTVKANIDSQIKLNFHTLQRIIEESKVAIQSRAQQ